LGGPVVPGTTCDMLGKDRRNRELYLWIAGACVVVFVVVLVVALLLDATGAIGGKRLASHQVKQPATVPVPLRAAPVVPVGVAPALSMHAAPTVTHSTTASTTVRRTNAPGLLPQARQVPEAPLPPATPPPVTTPTTLPAAAVPTAPLPTVSASTQLSVPTGSAAARVSVAAGPALALPDVLGVVRAPVAVQVRLG
jgi:hypothetical protein